MGRRGPPPTPTKVLQLRGTHRRDRHGDPADEVAFGQLTALPPAPGFLDRMGKAEWKRVGPELIEKGLLSEGDLAAFTAYCANVSRAVAAEKVLKREGLTFETAQGFLMPRPEVAIARQCWHQVRQFSQEFGLTPSARARVRGAAPPAPQQQSADPWEDVG